MIPEKYSRYITLGIVFLIIFLVYLILKPYISIILTGCILAYIFYPIYKLTKKIIRHETSSALLVSIVILILIFIPGLFVIVGLQEQVVSFYHVTKELISENGWNIECNEEGNFGCSLVQLATEGGYLSSENITGNFSNKIISWITSFLLSIPGMALNFIVIIFIMFYLFKDGEILMEYIKSLIKLGKDKKEFLFAKIKNVVDSIIFGNIIVALIQGAVGAIGFWILGLPSPLLWGILMAFFSLIPFIGTAIIWVPGSIILILTGLDNSGWIKGAILFAYGFLIIGGIDSLLKPVIIGDKAKIHPIIILVGVLGGLPLFGALGIVLGPLILGIAVTLLEFLKGDIRNDEIKSNTHRNKYGRSSRSSPKRT